MEALSYAARMGVNATFMYAYHIPVSLENIFLIVGGVARSPRRSRSRRARSERRRR